MSNNEITREISFEVEAKYFKENVTEYFSKYKNDSGAEDCIEKCLIREGYSAVLSAEEEINRQKAEIERLETENKLLIENDISNKYPNCVLVEKGRIYTRTLEDYDELIGDISAEAYKEFAERVKLLNQNNLILWNEQIDNLLKELVGEDE